MKEQRELKFRAWNGEEMIMLENSGLQYFDFEGNYSLGFTVDGYSGFWAHEQYESPTQEASAFPLMQWTGLKDRHLNDIYEGDIIQYTQALFNTKDEKWPLKQKEVKWDKYTGSWNVFETIAGELDIEVIGHIHEPAQQQKQTL